jgi:hypothetical protein
VAISPDGRWLAASSGGSDIPVTEERTRVWDLQPGRAGRDLPIRGRSHVIFSPDSRWLVVGGIQDYRFWRTGSWQPGLQIPRQSRGFSPGPAAFSRDGRMLAIARTPQLAQLLDPTDGKELATLEVPNPGILTGFAFSPDGSRLAAATEYGWVHLWDLGLIRRQLKVIGLDWGAPSPAVRGGRATPRLEHPIGGREQPEGARVVRIEAHGGAAIARGDPEGAARMFGAAVALRESTNSFVPPISRVRVTTAARASLAVRRRG